MCGDLTGPFHTLPCVVPVISGEIAGGHAHQGVTVDSGGAAPEFPRPLLHVPILTGTAGGLPFPHAWCLPRRGRQPCQVSMTSIQKLLVWLLLGGVWTVVKHLGKLQLLLFFGVFFSRHGVSK